MAVIVSQNIRPYVEAVEGLTSGLARVEKAKAEVIYLDKNRGMSRTDLTERLFEDEFDFFVAIGPGAAGYIWGSSEFEGKSRLYSMVLNPEKIFGSTETACGISLNIPVKIQLEMITRCLPSITRIGLIYDPAQNSEFFQKASLWDPFIGVNILPLKVSSIKDIPIVMKKNWNDLDALWLIPDHTVTGSDSIVQYIIKEALLKKVPVIGYNRFFYENGAALAFVLDYRMQGRQSAEAVLGMLSGDSCREMPPLFETWVNGRVMRKLGHKLLEEYPHPAKVGP
ncbi:MAG: hypothetical protein GY864_09320 [Desulfobacterales bacterium]|nr:hypothetical protein [Desulfobacterales bacterium]